MDSSLCLPCLGPPVISSLQSESRRCACLQGSVIPTNSGRWISCGDVPRYKLNAWLTLFSKFTNPKALHSTETLFALYRTLLSHPDRALQTVALNCVFTYKPPNLVRHEETFRHLLDDTLWRDELAHLDLSSLDATDRAIFVDAVIRLLFGMMLERKGRTKGGDRRIAVLSALAVCSEDELGLLVDLMLKPMGWSSRSWRDGGFVLTEVPSSVSLKQQVGFLNLLGQVLRHLGPRVVVHWPALLGTALNLIASAQSRLGGSKQSEAAAASGASEVQAEEEEDQEDTNAEANENVYEGSTRVVRSVRQLGFRRLADFFQETRDLVRETLCRIVVAFGPAYLPLALRELRAVLLRGPQLHMLAYVTHALLTYVTSHDRADAAFDDLDGCIDDVAHIDICRAERRAHSHWS